MSNANTKAVQLFLCCASITGSVDAIADIQFNGFGSVRGSYLSSDASLIDRPVTILPEDGELTFKDESIFGIQAKSDLGGGLSATIQMVADGREDFDLNARWAYLSYALNDQYTIHVGRLVNPIFYQSEYEIVGYAHNFARLPISVYQRFDFNTFEGIGLDSRFLLNGVNIDARLSYGTWDGTILIASTGQEESTGFDSLTSLKVQASKDWWTVYAGGLLTKFKRGSIDDFFETIVQGGVNAALQNGASTAEAEELFTLARYAESDASYWYAGYAIEYNNITSSFEYTSYGIDDSLFPDVDAWYLSLGYRLDDFVFTVRKERLNRRYEFDRFDFIENPILNATARSVHTVLGSANNINGVGATIRYDFHSNAALKLDYYTGNDNKTNDSDYHVITVGIDFIY